MTTTSTTSAAPAGHHWRETDIARALTLDPHAMSLSVHLHWRELEQHGAMIVLGDTLAPEGTFLALEHVFNDRQMLALMLMGDSDRSRALRSAALDSLASATPEALQAHFRAMGGTMLEPQPAPAAA